MDETISAVFVDDEYLERNLLKNCIDWEKLGIRIAGEASNADEALSLISRCRPDIVFTDINMPVMDGLKLSKLVLKNLPDIKIVVVTGFDDFEYAQKSIKMGISDFIVKPIIDDEVYKTVLNLKEQIEKRRSDEQSYSELRRQFLENIPYIREKFYNELIKCEVDQKSVKERMAFLGVTLREGIFQIAAIECGAAQDLAPDEERRFLAVMKILNMARDYFKGMIVFFDTMSRIVVIGNDENADLYEQCEAFMERAKDGGDCDICIGLGTIRKDLRGISLSYKEALDALRYKIAAGSNSVILYSAIRLSDKKSAGDLDELNGRLAFCIKSCLLKNSAELVENHFDGIDIKAGNAIKTVRITAINIVSICLRLLSESGADPDYIYKENFSTNSDIIMLNTLPEAKAYVNGVIKKSIELIGGMNDHKISDLIGDVKKYVDENYSSSKLSLTATAKKFFLNASYLSRTFKKEAGVSFVEYITSVRMEKAMSLLRHSEIKAFELAEIVGIPDANYFCSCFKKYTGVSVSDFKKAERNDPGSAAQK